MAMTKVKINRIMDELQLAITNIRTNIMSGSYTDVKTIANTSHIIQTNKEDEFNKALKSLSDSFSVSVDVNGEDASFFEIQFRGVSSDLCRQIASTDWGDNAFISAKQSSGGMTVVGGTTEANGDRDAILKCQSLLNSPNPVIFWVILKLK